MSPPTLYQHGHVQCLWQPPRARLSFVHTLGFSAANAWQERESLSYLAQGPEQQRVVGDDPEHVGHQRRVPEPVLPIPDVQQAVGLRARVADAAAETPPAVRTLRLFNPLGILNGVCLC